MPEERIAVDILLQELDKKAEFRGVRVVYYDGSVMKVLRKGPPYCASGLSAVVLRKGGKGLVPTEAEVAEARDQRFYQELTGVILGCGGATIAFLAFWGSIGAAPVSGGSSLLVSGLSKFALAAGVVQCSASAIRLHDEIRNEGKANDWLDSKDWYGPTMLLLDAVSLAGATAATGATIRAVKLLSKSKSKPMKAVLQGLQRHERKRLTEELIRLQHPGISNRKLKALVAAGVYPKRYPAGEMQRGLQAQLLDALSAAIAFSGSAAAGLVRKAASSVAAPKELPKPLIIGVVEAFETY